MASCRGWLGEFGRQCFEVCNPRFLRRAFDRSVMLHDDTTVEGAVRAELAEHILTGSRVEFPALIGLTDFNMVSQDATVDSSQGSRTPSNVEGRDDSCALTPRNK